MKHCIVIFLLLNLILILGAASMAPALHPEEAGLLVEMLGTAGFDSTSLAFEKDWDLSTQYKSPLQLAQLQDPWKAFGYLDSLRAICASDSLPARKIRQLMALDTQSSPGSDLYYEAMRAELTQMWEKTVRNPSQIFKYWEKVLKLMGADYTDETSILSQAQHDSLAAFHLLSNSQSEDSVAYRVYLADHNIPYPDDLSPLSYTYLLDSIPILRNCSSAILYYLATEVMIEHLPGMKFSRKEILTHDSPWGMMIIGSTGDDRYTKGKPNARKNRPCFVLDPGGNDFYALEFSTDNRQPYYLCLDLKGDDIYQNESIAELFSVREGLGLSLDLEGNDLYRGGDFSFSSFAGVNIHRDVRGEDIYQGGSFSQGAAFFGTSLLLDEAGDDQYSASTMAQGLGSTRGFGAILDSSGSDRYFLGAKYTDPPLMPNDYRSMGQGMGFGFRPDFAGGTGMIYDRSGNDKYIGAVYAQGVGYWYATGILIDEKGNDVYNAIYYPQGSGIHLANGYLYDGEGDDAYYTRNGPGQGAGHDWAVGIFLDKAGDDAYSIPGGNGLGLNNSVGIFIDSKGNDRYERRNPSSYGYGSFSRSTGSLGLFLDAGGKDSYPDSLFADDKSWQLGSYGFGRDLERFITDKTVVEEMAEEAALVDSLAEISVIFGAASEWEVGSAVKRVRNARKVMLSRENEAITYILENKLDSKSGLEYRAFEELVDNSPKFKDSLYRYIDDADSLKAKNAMSLIASTGDSLLIEPIRSLLNRELYVTSCLSCLGAIPSDRSVDILREYVSSPVERFRYITARSLLGIKTPAAKSLLREMKEDRSFLVQSLIRSIKDTDR